jgi:hypothetical protein
LIAVWNEGKTTGRGEDFVCRVYRSNAKLRGKSMKERASKLSGKIGIREKYYPNEALSCESVKFDRSKSLEKKGEQSGFRPTLLLCCKKDIPPNCSLKRLV